MQAVNHLKFSWVTPAPPDTPSSSEVFRPGAGTHKRPLKKPRSLTQRHKSGRHTYISFRRSITKFSPIRNLIPPRTFLRAGGNNNVRKMLYHLCKSWHFNAASHLTFMLFALMPVVSLPFSFLGPRLRKQNADGSTDITDAASTQLRLK